MDQPLTNYILQLADNSLIMGHRLSEWTGHGPILEQDIAITNIALDHIGQARNFYQYAALVLGDNYDEDKLAYLRDAKDFKNVLLIEQPNGDWAQTILKIFYFSNYQSLLYQQLLQSNDEQIKAIAEKSLKEITYHLRWSSEWVIRLGDGTTESHERMQNAIIFLSPFIAELFNEDENVLSIDMKDLKEAWIKKTALIFKEATLPFNMNNIINDRTGKKVKHTIHLTEILNEMQYLQRTYPECKW